MKSLSLALLGAVLVALSSLSSAATDNKSFIGQWSGSGEGQIEATIRKSGSGLIAEVSVGRGGGPPCAGGLVVKGSVKDNVFTGFFEPKGDDPKCMITMTLQGKSLRIEEEYSTCNSYHGFSCAFDGTLKKKR
jgi:hypothetical protein